MPIMKEDPNRVQADYDLENRRMDKGFVERSEERKSKIRLAELELEKEKVIASVSVKPEVAYSRWRGISRVFEVPARLVALIVIYLLQKNGKKPVKALLRFLND